MSFFFDFLFGNKKSLLPNDNDMSFDEVINRVDIKKNRTAPLEKEKIDEYIRFFKPKSLKFWIGLLNRKLSKIKYSNKKQYIKFFLKLMFFGIKHILPEAKTSVVFLLQQSDNGNYKISNLQLLKHFNAEETLSRFDMAKKLCGFDSSKYRVVFASIKNSQMKELDSLLATFEVKNNHGAFRIVKLFSELITGVFKISIYPLGLIAVAIAFIVAFMLLEIGIPSSVIQITQISELIYITCLAIVLILFANVSLWIIVCFALIYFSAMIYSTLNLRARIETKIKVLLSNIVPNIIKLIFAIFGAIIMVLFIKNVLSISKQKNFTDNSNDNMFGVITKTFIDVKKEPRLDLLISDNNKSKLVLLMATDSNFAYYYDVEPSKIKTAYNKYEKNTTKINLSYRDEKADYVREAKNAFLFSEYMRELNSKQVLKTIPIKQYKSVANAEEMASIIYH